MPSGRIDAGIKHENEHGIKHENETHFSNYQNMISSPESEIIIKMLSQPEKWKIAEYPRTEGGSCKIEHECGLHLSIYTQDGIDVFAQVKSVYLQIPKSEKSQLWLNYIQPSLSQIKAHEIVAEKEQSKNLLASLQSMFSVAEGEIEVVEYWPGFFEKDREPFKATVKAMDDVKHIPWLREKAPLVFEGRYVKSDGLVVAILNQILMLI
jgi:hypothetical protein